MSRTSSTILRPEDQGNRSCPSCGRYVGPHEACPTCGARLTGRLSIHLVKVAAIALATVGLAVLWLVATGAEVPTVAIGEAGATMNLAYVRVDGRCTGVPSYDPESDTLSFWIADETGELRVVSYRAQTRALIEQGKVPAMGDRVSVAGTLRIREDFRSLTIDAPEQVTITRVEPVGRAIGSIAPDDAYRRVRVRGQVRALAEPYQGLTLITLRDVTGNIDVAVSNELIALSGEASTLKIGQPVEVAAAVSLYDGTPQLVPASTADIVPLDEDVAIAAERFIVELDRGDVGRWVAVRGVVIDVDPFSAGVKLTLDDGSGSITLLLWQDVYDGLRNSEEPTVGAEVRAQGELSEYRGELELIPGLTEDVEVLAAATSPPEITPIGALTSDDVGRWVTLAGALGPPEPFSAGVKFALDDGTGRITLLMWDDVCQRAPPGLGEGAEIVVTGQVGEYRGELELTELTVEKMEVVRPAARRSRPEVQRIGDITAADAGKTVMLRGVLGEEETFSSGVRFPLSDGSDSIILLLWQEVYEAIPDVDLLAPGTEVEVTGRIEQYRGDIEILPEADGVRVTR